MLTQVFRIQQLVRKLKTKQKIEFSFIHCSLALSVFKSLQSNHIDVQLFMYPDAGHAFANADEPKNYNAAGMSFDCFDVLMFFDVF